MVDVIELLIDLINEYAKALLSSEFLNIHLSLKLVSNNYC